jgi:outer membrane protein assembly factor BamB
MMQLSKKSVRAIFALCCIGLTAFGGDWPQWRGPRGDSVSDETGLPTVWSESKSVVWKSPLPEWGTSTPAIWGDAIFLTSHVEEQDALLLIKLDKRTGAVEWTRQVGTGEANRTAPSTNGRAGRGPQKFHNLHNLASPSPVTDGKLVVVHFGNGDLAAYDLSGNRLWKRNLQHEHGAYTIWWGHANSPVLSNDLVISVCMQDSLADLGEPPAPSYVIAHDKRTGEVKWKTMRMTNATAEECDSYVTPVLHQSAARTQLIVIGGDQVDAYEPATGKQLWYLPGLAKSRIITGPTIGRDRVYVTMGMRGPLLAIPLRGNGELSAEQVAWRYDKGTPDSCCPVLWRELVFIISDNGIAQCLDASSGRLHWQERLPGDYKASPVAADGSIYFLNTRGLCTVVAASAKFAKLSENTLDDETIASPAVANGNLYLRGKSKLYCLGKPLSDK